MERLIARFWLARIVRDLPIGLKLAMTVFGALSMLTAVSLFALDRLGFVTAMQQAVAAQPPRATVDVCLVPGEPCAERVVAAIDAARKEVTEFPPHPRHHGPRP
jgi:hypothetical protein